MNTSGYYTIKSTEVPTQVYEDQKPGTSGLRKKTKLFETSPGYLENFIQSIFNSETQLRGKTLVLGGDGRYLNRSAIQTICQMAAANGIRRVWIGQDGLLSTPAVSCIIRRRENGIAEGGIILTASHNPGGPEHDFGIKYNLSNGGPAPSTVTERIYVETKQLRTYRIAHLPPINLHMIKDNHFQVDGKPFSVEIISSTEDYLQMLDEIFDWTLLKQLFKRKDFSFKFDALNGVAGPYAEEIFGNRLSVAAEHLMGCKPLEDFGGLHPDPNLTYATALVKTMGLHSDGSEDSSVSTPPSFGAATDGDADRAMILGERFFVSPSDSLALMCYYSDQIPFFKKEGGLRSVARSMPTSRAVDSLASSKGWQLSETPTGWKYFCTLMDSEDHTPLICGEESFGAGSNHIREKDGLWAILMWLSILALHNQDVDEALVGVGSIVKEYWKMHGRNYYVRFDYEGCESTKAKTVMQHLRTLNASNASNALHLTNSYIFEYHDPIDGSVATNQGHILEMSDGSRIVFRLSGTSSTGATIRMYLESPESTNFLQSPLVAMEDLINKALALSRLPELTGFTKPTNIA